MRTPRLLGTLVAVSLGCGPIGCGAPASSAPASTTPAATTSTTPTAIAAITPPATAGSQDPQRARAELERRTLTEKAAAVNKQDAPAVANAYAADARTFSLGAAGFEETARGRAAIARDQAEMIAKFELRFELDRVLLGGDVGVIEWNAAGTYRPNGRPVHLRGGQVVHFSDDGHIATEHSYSDNASAAVQVGLVPGRARAASPMRGATTWVVASAGPRQADLLARVRAALPVAWSAGDGAAFTRALADDVVIEEMALPFDVKGKTDALALLSAYRTAMPDLAMTVDDAWTFDGTVVMMTTLNGTLSGRLFDLAPTGKRVAFHFLEIVDTKGDAITRIRRYANRYEWLEQAGAFAATKT
jgi:ketosteroid isomerase-like protein